MIHDFRQFMIFNVSKQVGTIYYFGKIWTDYFWLLVLIWRVRC